MTVQELIDELMKVEDKTKNILLQGYTFDPDGEEYYVDDKWINSVFECKYYFVINWEMN